MHVSQLTQPESEHTQATPQSEQVRRKMAKRRQCPLPDNVREELVVQKDNSMSEVMLVVEKCGMNRFTPQDIMAMEDKVIPTFYSPDFFKLGDD